MTAVRHAFALDLSMSTFTLYAPYGALKVSTDPTIKEGDAFVFTLQGNRHTVWAPQTVAEALQAGDAVLALGEAPCALLMNPGDWARVIRDLNAGGKKPTSCECGSTKVGSPYHSSWCPSKGLSP